MDDYTIDGQTSGADTEPFDWSTDVGDTEEADQIEQEDPVYDIDGKQYKASDLRNFIKGGMFEKDYRVKTAEIAEERRQMEEIRKAAEAWQAVQEHPDLRQALAQKFAEILQGGGEPTEQGYQPEYPDQGEVEPWKGEIGSLKEQLAGVLGAYDQRMQEYNTYLWQQYYAGRESEAKAQLPALQQKYRWMNPDEVIAYYRDVQEANLEEAARESHEYWAQFVAERTKADAEKRRQNAGARVQAPAARGGAPATRTAEPADWDAARQSAIERLRKVGFSR